MNEVGLDLQLICQGAGLYADQLPAEQALKIMRESNRLLAERLASHRDRLMGVTALSLKNIDASGKEGERNDQELISKLARLLEPPAVSPRSEVTPSKIEPPPTAQPWPQAARPDPARLPARS